LGSALLAN